MRLIMQITAVLPLLALLPIGGADSEEHLEALLDTEATLIDTLRSYIDSLETQLQAVKMETNNIASIHQQVGSTVEQHVNNPLNVLLIMKRFESVWPVLQQQANETLKLGQQVALAKWQLELPSSADYDQALSNLLRLQSIYELETSSLSVGIVNGLKLGSAMSWSDCVEIALKSEKNGEYALAKYWLDTAMGKLPAALNETQIEMLPAPSERADESERAKVYILETALNMEFRQENFLQALQLTEQLLLLRPDKPSLKKAKAKINAKLADKKHRHKEPKPQLSKTVQQQRIEQLCRLAAQSLASTGSRLQHCRLDSSLPWLVLQPLRVEQLSRQPELTLYHNVLDAEQADELSALMDELPQRAPAAQFAPMKFCKLGQKKMRRLTEKLQIQGILQQAATAQSFWQGRRHGHEHVASAQIKAAPQRSHQTQAMLNLQQAQLGGAVIFPQLQLGVNVPLGSLLYWRGEELQSEAAQYHSGPVVCPVLLGTQMSAWTADS